MIRKREGWTRVYADLSEVLQFARGTYQIDLIEGRESFSGSTLTGKAGQYRPHYRRSRDNLLRRLTAAGYSWTIEPEGRANILIIDYAKKAAA